MLPSSPRLLPLGDPAFEHLLDAIDRATLGRRAEVRFILQAIASGHDIAVVGMSNLGKSTLLRGLFGSAGARDNRHLWVYVDCNYAAERSSRGFYELVLRGLVAAAGGAAGHPDLRAALERAYSTVVGPSSGMEDALAFNRSLETVLADDRRLVLCLDELDGLATALDGQVFLNLRALKDRYASRLSYVVALDRPLFDLRQDRDAGEFTELFNRRTYWLPPLNREAAEAVALTWAAREGVPFDDADLEFIRQQADGHPGLIGAVAVALAEALSDDPRTPAQSHVVHSLVRERLAMDTSIQSECDKVWEDVEREEERDALMELAVGGLAEPTLLHWPRRRHLVVGSDDAPRLFCQAFADYVRRRRLSAQPGGAILRVDVEAGDVYVDGRKIPALTELEYKLLLLLYGRLNQIVDKYEIVQAVWGQEYIDTVDDGRIERLVGRLREKLEPDQRNPRFLTTVRGRGYRLTA